MHSTKANLISQAIKYLRFILSSTNAHGIHSPFVFELYNSVVKDDRWFYVFRDFEAVRSSLKKNNNPIKFQEHGAGSQKLKSNDKTVASIAENALSFPYQCRLMFRLIEHMKYRNILELGTSLGISSLYLAASSKDINLHTLEGDHGSHDVANHLFKETNMKRITSTLGLFKDTLIPTLKRLRNVDLAFIDGHHDEKATIEYFETIIPYCKDYSAVVVDDIYWSAGMTNAWKSIQEHEKVTLSIDLFFCGIVFFRKENKEKEHFKIRPDKLLFHL